MVRVSTNKWLVVFREFAFARNDVGEYVRSWFQFLCYFHETSCSENKFMMIGLGAPFSGKQSRPRPSLGVNKNGGNSTKKWCTDFQFFITQIILLKLQ